MTTDPAPPPGADPAGARLPLWLRLLPRRAVSRATGWLAGLPLPGVLRGPLYGAFARRYGADLGEMAGTLRDYRTFGDFFGRPLQPGRRPVAAGDGIAVSPADGRVVTAGAIERGRIPQVKGVDYALIDLVRDDAIAARLLGGQQLTVYLAPGDYHRVHMPLAGRPLCVVHVPGDLFPVNAAAVAAVPGLFVRNERVTVLCEDPAGRAFAVVMVGALNVGGIRLDICPELVTNRGRAGSRRDLAVPPLASGALLGRFAFGSTVVAVFGPHVRVDALAPGQRVRVGEAIGRVAGSA